jgi:hypothetical protein
MGWRPKRALERFSAFDHANPRESRPRPSAERAISGHFRFSEGIPDFPDESPASFRRRSMSHDGT